MSAADAPHLFERVGVAIDAMIVDADSLAIRPLADELLSELGGAGASVHQSGAMRWRPALARHVIQLETTAPDTAGLSELFLEQSRAIDRHLAQAGCRLLPGAMHPWMDAAGEFELFPHRDHRIHQHLHRIFDCGQHGWSNLQRVKIHLPFQGDEEFGRLHAAIRLLLPLIPALAAASPYADGRRQVAMDHGLTAYRGARTRVPSIIGQVVPEPIYTIGAYHDLLATLYQEIAVHDPEGLLQHEWLNARGAIARFDRNDIEIGVIDSQECAGANLAIVEIIVASVRALSQASGAQALAQRNYATSALAKLFDACIRDAEAVTITAWDYLRLLGVTRHSQRSAGQLWGDLIEFAAADGALSAATERHAEDYLRRGSLARRLVEAAGPEPSHAALHGVYQHLADCLQADERF